jgi:hypothetical protein
MLDNYLPVFEIYYPAGVDQFVIKNQDKFHNRVIEFIELRLSGNFESNDPDDNLLCFFKLKEDESNHLEARLEPEGYEKSLDQCLSYFTKSEEYEKCKKIKKLKEQIN